MNIPIGVDYIFTIQVLVPESFDVLDVTGYTGTFTVYRREDMSNTPIDDIAVNPVAGEELNGKMSCTIPASLTNGMTVPPEDIGYPADSYYIKSRHEGFIHITKSGENDINVKVPRVRFFYTGG